jgi:hypothetical protein
MTGLGSIDRASSALTHECLRGRGREHVKRLRLTGDPGARKGVLETVHQCGRNVGGITVGDDRSGALPPGTEPTTGASSPQRSATFSTACGELLGWVHRPTELTRWFN